MGKISEFFQNLPCFQQKQGKGRDGVVDLMIDVPEENLRGKQNGLPADSDHPYILASSLSKPMRDAAVKKVARHPQSHYFKIVIFMCHLDLRGAEKQQPFLDHLCLRCHGRRVWTTLDLCHHQRPGSNYR